MKWTLSNSRLSAEVRGVLVEVEKEARGYRLSVAGERRGFFDTEAAAKSRGVKLARKLAPRAPRSRGSKLCPGPHAEGDRRKVWACGLCYFHYRQRWDGKTVLTEPGSWGGDRKSARFHLKQSGYVFARPYIVAPAGGRK